MPLTRLELHHANFEDFFPPSAKHAQRFAPQVPESGTRAKDRMEVVADNLAVYR